MRKHNPLMGACLALLALRPELATAGEALLDENWQNGINPGVWEIVQRPGNGQGTAKAEAEFYVASAVSGDAEGMHLTARRETAIDRKTGNTFNFTSGRLESRQSFCFGHFEFLVRLPAGKGFWPALWLRTPEKLPFDGEIDVLEGFGSHAHALQSTLHRWADGQHLGQQCALLGLDFRRNTPCSHNTDALPAPPPDFTTGYHRFALDWRADHISWSLDGHVYFTVSREIPQIPMRLVLNLAVGGNFDGAPDSDTLFPASLDVRQVTVTP